MSHKFGVGIDLGTSTSEICIYKPKIGTIPIHDPVTRTPIVPSIVGIDKKERIVVGEAAKPFVNISGHGVREIKRKIGSNEIIRLGNLSFKPEEISAFILTYLKEMAENYTGEQIKDIVLTVPANFDDLQRKATLNAAKIAGLNVLRLINEPTAAALAYGISEKNAEGQVVVVDFGGGTLDVTVLEMMEGVLDVKATYGLTNLGGKDIDDIIVSYALQGFKENHPKATIPDHSITKLKTEAELAKIRLSNDDYTQIEILGFAVEKGKPSDLEIEIRRDMFEKLMEPVLKKAEECIIRALSIKDVKIQDVDKVLLVGGTTYIPCVRKMIKNIFKKDPVFGVDPDLAVSIGAATRAAITLGLIDEEEIVIADVCSHGFGIDCVAIVGNQPMLVYDQLIAPNTTIPYTVTKEYSLLSPDQREVEINLYQDHDGNARLPEHCKKVATAIISDIPPALYGTPHPILVDFSYNVDGSIVVNARIPGINKSCTIKFHPINQDGEDENAINDEILLEDSKFYRYKPLIKKAKEYISHSKNEMSIIIEEKLLKLENSIREEDYNLADLFANELFDLLYDEEEGKNEL